MQWRAGTVVEQVRRWPGAVEYSVALDEAADPPVRALAYTAMVGEPAAGERVLLPGVLAEHPQREHLGAAAIAHGQTSLWICPAATPPARSASYSACTKASGPAT